MYQLVFFISFYFLLSEFSQNLISGKMGKYKLENYINRNEPNMKIYFIRFILSILFFHWHSGNLKILLKVVPNSITGICSTANGMFPQQTHCLINFMENSIFTTDWCGDQIWEMKISHFWINSLYVLVIIFFKIFTLFYFK